MKSIYKALIQADINNIELVPTEERDQEFFDNTYDFWGFKILPYLNNKKYKNVVSSDITNYILKQQDTIYSSTPLPKGHEYIYGLIQYLGYSDLSKVLREYPYMATHIDCEYIEVGHFEYWIGGFQLISEKYGEKFAFEVLDKYPKIYNNTRTKNASLYFWYIKKGGKLKFVADEFRTPELIKLGVETNIVENVEFCNSVTDELVLKLIDNNFDLYKLTDISDRVDFSNISNNVASKVVKKEPFTIRLFSNITSFSEDLDFSNISLKGKYSTTRYFKYCNKKQAKDLLFSIILNNKQLPYLNEAMDRVKELLDTYTDSEIEDVLMFILNGIDEHGFTMRDCDYDFFQRYTTPSMVINWLDLTHSKNNWKETNNGLKLLPMNERTKEVVDKYINVDGTNIEDVPQHLQTIEVCQYFVKRWYGNINKVNRSYITKELFMLSIRNFGGRNSGDDYNVIKFIKDNKSVKVYEFNYRYDKESIFKTIEKEMSKLYLDDDTITVKFYYDDKREPNEWVKPWSSRYDD